MGDGGAAFSGTEALSREDLALLCVAGYGPACEATATAYGWDGSAAGYVILSLSNDNSLVESGRFGIIGSVTGMRIATSRLWPDAQSNIYLQVDLPDCTAASFSAGGLWSDLLGEDQV